MRRFLKNIDRLLASLINNNVTHIEFLYLPVLFYSLQLEKKNILRECHDVSRFLKNIERCATRTDFSHLLACVTISNGNRTEWSPIRSVIIRVIAKSDNRAYRLWGQHEILKCIILKIKKEKKRKEDVCSLTKSILD